MTAPLPPSNHKRRVNARAPRVQFRVTQEMIDSAVKGDSSRCMIRDAIAAAVPGAKRITVDAQLIAWTDPEARMRYTYLTPRTSQVLLVMWDQGAQPEPFSGQLRNGAVTPCRVGGAPPPRAEVVAGAPGHRARISGGKSGPRGVLGINRRQFGIRSLNYSPSPANPQETTT
jgi:hypothetical protein